jgi:hypothetical protein
MHTTVFTFFIAVALAMSPLGNGNRSTVLITNLLREILYFYDEILRYLVTVIVAIYPCSPVHVVVTIRYQSFTTRYMDQALQLQKTLSF